MIRKLPNMSAVMPADSNSHPWKVERRWNRCEHVDFVGGRTMKTRETFSYSLVGRYMSAELANAAALRSAQRHGGFAMDSNGCSFPYRPFPRPTRPKR